MVLETLLIGLIVSVHSGKDTTLVPSRITALKESIPLEMVPSPVTRITSKEMTAGGIYRQGKLSGMVPGLYIPDYGASLTSTIYMRGLGSRMENPVMGLYIDGIPVLDKNMYDIDWFSVGSATMLRGPQGTLYGRNTMGGVLDLRTLSPSSLDKTLINLEYGTANYLRVAGTAAFGQNVLSVGFRHTDGYFLNEFKGEPCDPYNGLSVRWKWENDSSKDWLLSNSLHFSASKEGGFAYGLINDGIPGPVSYNGDSGYGRISVLEGLKGRYSGNPSFIIDATVSAQFLADDMRMDQDYTPMDIFTLEQKQKSGAGTVEIVMRKKESKDSWQPLTGIFAFGRHTGMSAPVAFKREGIQTLILDNANSNIPSQIGHLEITDDEFPVDSDFRITTAGAALFHESSLTSGRWRMTAGIRLDYEAAFMRYDCLSNLHYRFVPIMASAKAYSLPYSGSLGHSRMQVLPKFSVLFSASEGLYIFSTVSKGSRAGGFNTQIFSDILQNMMMNGLMNDLGVHLDRPTVSILADNTEYDPETAWNHEIGARYNKGGFHTEASVYLINVRNQQLTVFPPGMSTGRMMTNAGRSRSVGAEIEASWNHKRFHSRLSYGFCDSRFIEYVDGENNYGGNRVPYVPSHTLHINAGYGLDIGGRTLDLDMSLRGVGPISWNETGNLQEPMRLFLEARAGMDLGLFEIFVRGENLTGTGSGVFYFKSIGREFLASGKPRSITTGIIVNI